MRRFRWRGVVALACLFGCGVDAEPDGSPPDVVYDVAWTFEKAQFTEPWTWTLVEDGAVVFEGVVLAEVRQRQVVFHDTAPCASPYETSWCAQGLGSDDAVDDAALIVPITDHVDPPGASTVKCAGGEGLGCRDTAGLWYERDLMVWTDELDAHVLRVAERGCVDGEADVRAVSFERGEEVLGWEVERSCGGAPVEVVRVELRR